MHINNNTPASRLHQLLHVLDVDGTLTHHDSLLLLVKYAKPAWRERMYFWAKLFPAALAALATGQLWKLKVALLSRLWKGQQQKKIATFCNRFFEDVLQYDIRTKALEYIAELRRTNSDTQLVLLSASCRPWLQPLAHYLQAELICSELELDEHSVFTGRFATPNCKGQEKVKRLLKQYPADAYEFICYADSPSDRSLQSISKQFFYRYF